MALGGFGIGMSLMMVMFLLDQEVYGDRLLAVLTFTGGALTVAVGLGLILEGTKKEGDDW